MMSFRNFISTLFIITCIFVPHFNVYGMKTDGTEEPSLSKTLKLDKADYELLEEFQTLHQNLSKRMAQLDQLDNFKNLQKNLKSRLYGIKVQDANKEMDDALKSDKEFLKEQLDWLDTSKSEFLKKLLEHAALLEESRNNELDLLNKLEKNRNELDIQLSRLPNLYRR